MNNSLIYKIKFGTSAGYFLDGEALKDFEFYSPYIYKSREFDNDIRELAYCEDELIKNFMEKWGIIYINELVYGPCGHNIFTIKNNEYVKKYGLECK